MMLVHRRKTNDYLLRPRCKACNNARERGARREWKTKYLRRWRRENKGLNESYWRTATELNREKINSRARKRFIENHDALLIQGRLRRRLGLRVSIDEANKILKRYGRCYPTQFGLTPEGKKECERIRSRMRRVERAAPSLIEIRMMVYEDGHYIKPNRQPIPYRKASERLSKLQSERRNAED